MKDWLLIALVSTGAVVVVVTVVIALYLVAVYAHVSGFALDIRRYGVKEGFRKFIWGQPRKNSVSRY